MNKPNTAGRNKAVQAQRRAGVSGDPEEATVPELAFAVPHHHDGRDYRRGDSADGLDDGSKARLLEGRVIAPSPPDPPPQQSHESHESPLRFPSGNVVGGGQPKDVAHPTATSLTETQQAEDHGE